MPSPLDLAFTVFFSVVVVMIGGGFVDRRLRRQLAEGIPDARRDWYQTTIVGQWVLAVLALALWWKEGRDWRSLGLEPPTDWRLYVGVTLAILVTTFLLRQNARVRGLPPDLLDRLAGKFTGVESIIPRSMHEYQWFVGLSWTAGACEELLYRGLLTWVVASYAGTAAAVVIASIAFGLGHAYQGRKGMVKAAIVGLAFSCIVLISGWLVPAMIIHALVDSSSAAVGLAVLGRETRRSADLTPSEAR